MKLSAKVCAPGYGQAVAAVALAETIQFMVSTTEAVSPSSLYAGLVAKVAVLVAVCLKPSLLGLLSRPRVALPCGLAFAACVGVIYAGGNQLVLASASFVFYGCEMAAVLTAGQMLFARVPVRDVAPAALVGVFVAFCAALVLFSLPSPVSIALQITLALACGLFPLACNRPLKYAAKPEGPSAPASPAPEAPARVTDTLGASGTAGVAHIPVELAFAVCFFAFGIQISYLNFWSACDWASSFALAVVISLALLVIEFCLVRPTRISFVDLASAAMVSIPAIFAGAGVGEPSILVALSSIGFYLFLPRVFQVAASAGSEHGTNPVRLLAEAELALSLAEVAATVVIGTPAFAQMGPVASLSVSVTVATGCILSAFALYETRTREIIYGFIADEPSPAEHAGYPLPSDAPDDAPPPDLLATACRAAAQRWALTNREEEMLLPLVEGATLASICRSANVSMSTIKSHVYHIYQKTGVHSREELRSIVLPVGEQARESTR